jgi:DNA polymerase III subunit gamma/tau
MTSLYRRHRPQSFDDVVGQAHIVRTMRNAVEQEKVHHAYLFVGSRGTGKTSIAKILARSLNCVNGPTLTPCGECESCITIANSTSLDVIEMDAASNNSVDDIRDLREKVGFAPALGGWKVYILDEAHMLSSAAWNAFLKTLEEPPPNTIFVLATTEAHKVPATIVDRCHRFDFQRPSLEELTTVLRRVSDAEQIEADDRTLAMISRSAAGSFRDAIGTLDQLVTYGGSQVAFEDVLEVLDVADADLIFNTTDAIAAHDPRAALERVEELAQSGRDMTQFMRDLVAHLRQLVVIQTVGEVPDTFSVTADQTERLEAQATAISQGEAVRAMDLLSDALAAVKEGSDPRIQLELALLKAAGPRADASIEALLARIELLEQSAGAAPDAGEPAPAGSSRSRRSGGPSARFKRSEPEAATPAPDPRPATAVAEPDAAVGQEAGTQSPPPVQELAVLWPAVLDRVRALEGGPMLGALLAHAQPLAMDGETLVVSYPASAAFSKRKVESQANRERVMEALRQISGRSLAVRFELGEHAAEPAETGAADPPLDEDEVIERMKELFDAEDVLEQAPADDPGEPEDSSDNH